MTDTTDTEVVLVVSQHVRNLAGEYAKSRGMPKATYNRYVSGDADGEPLLQILDKAYTQGKDTVTLQDQSILESMVKPVSHELDAAQQLVGKLEAAAVVSAMELANRDTAIASLEAARDRHINSITELSAQVTNLRSAMNRIHQANQQIWWGRQGKIEAILKPFIQ